MVRPERFELPTTWFEARCSIQLSYGRRRASLAERGSGVLAVCTADPGPPILALYIIGRLGGLAASGAPSRLGRVESDHEISNLRRRGLRLAVTGTMAVISPFAPPNKEDPR